MIRRQVSGIIHSKLFDVTTESPPLLFVRLHHTNRHLKQFPYTQGHYNIIIQTASLILLAMQTHQM